MVRRSLQGARGIVTGVSSGIGQALARELVQAGARIVVTARRADRLESFVQSLGDRRGQVGLLSGDITNPDHRSQVCRLADQWLGGLDFLVNNAGQGGTGEFSQSDASRLRRIMEVNFFAPVELIREALPRLYQGRTPIIVNVSSVLGHRGVPRKSEYCASKFALHGFSDALRAELVPRGIDVLLVSPSTTDTEFFEKYGEGKPSLGRRWLRPMSPDSVARQTLRAMQRGCDEIILSLGGRSIVWLDRLWPTLANRLVARWG